MAKKALLITGAALVVASAIAMWLVWGREYIVELDQAQVQKALDAGFPVEKTYLGIVGVELTEPVMNLQEHSDRIRLAVNVGVGLPGITRRLRGKAELSGQIRYVAAQGSFYSDDLTVEGLTVGGLPDKYVEKTRGAVAWAMKGVLEGRPVYTLRAGDVRQSAAKLLLKEVRVTHGKLRLTLRVGQ
jgi:hypothetical protein